MKTVLLLVMTVAALVGGCSFRPLDYAGKSCADGFCPEGLVCSSSKVCEATGTAGGDASTAPADASTAGDKDASETGDGGPGDAGGSTTDAGGVDAGGAGLAITGGVRSLAPGPRSTSTLAVTNDGFETQGQSCAGQLCVSGGIVP